MYGASDSGRPDKGHVPKAQKYESRRVKRGTVCRRPLRDAVFMSRFLGMVVIDCNKPQRSGVEPRSLSRTFTEAWEEPGLQFTGAIFSAMCRSRSVR